jgi:hypothetical protein
MVPLKSSLASSSRGNPVPSSMSVARGRDQLTADMLVAMCLSAPPTLRVAVRAGLDVPLKRDGKYCSVTERISHVLYVNFLVRPVAEADIGSRSSAGGEACSGNAEHKVHGRVKIEEQDGGGESVADESREEEDDTVLEEELPERRAARCQKQSDGGNDEHRQIDEHGVEVEQVQGEVVVLRASGKEDACLRLRDEGSLDRGHRVHEYSPMSNSDEDKGDCHEEVLVPDGDCAEHEEGRCSSDGGTSEELVESVQTLAINFGGGVESDEHANDGE